MNIISKLICSLLIPFASSVSFAQEGQPRKDSNENEQNVITCDGFIFDKFDASRNLKSRNQSLDAFALQLRFDPGKKGYLVSSGGRVSYPREAKERAELLKKYLVEVGGLEAERIVIVDAGYCEQWSIDLLIYANPNPATPSGLCNLNPKEVKIIEKSRYNRKKVLKKSRTLKSASNKSLNRTRN